LTQQEIPAPAPMARNQTWEELTREPAQEEYHPRSPMENWYRDMKEVLPEATYPSKDMRKKAPPKPQKQYHYQQKMMPSSPGASNATPDSQQEYMQRYAEKMKKYSPDVSKSSTETRSEGKLSPRATSSSNSPWKRPTLMSDIASVKKEGQSLVDDMNATIRNLQTKMERQRRNLEEKDSEIHTSDEHLELMDQKEQSLVEELARAQTAANQHQQDILQKRSHIEAMQRHIRQLQEDIQREEACLESLDQAYASCDANTASVERRLKYHRNEQGNLGVARQSLEDDRENLLRELTNTESELKSLQAIQNLAMSGDENM